MIKKILFNYSVPVLLGVLMFASNFLNTDLFTFGSNNFAVWFVLSVLCFACGWFINKTLGWHYGGKVVFATIIAATLISVFMISFFRDYFNAGDLLTENLILYSLRNITLGSISFFGMAIVQVLTMQKDIVVLEEKVKNFESSFQNIKKEAQLELRETKIKIEKLMNDAELRAKSVIQRKERIEEELKEFIQAEKELLKKYENL